MLDTFVSYCLWELCKYSQRILLQTRILAQEVEQVSFMQYTWPYTSLFLTVNTGLGLTHEVNLVKWKCFAYLPLKDYSSDSN